MALSLRTNVASLNAQRNLYQTQNSLDSSMARLSSGFRITKSGDDSAGLAISSSLDAQIKSYDQAVRNANDGISLAQTAESSLNNVSNILGRLRQLAMEAASDGVSDTDRASFIQVEANANIDEITRVAASSEYNGTKLLNQALQLDFQVGIRNGTSNVISVTTADVSSLTGIANGAGFSTKAEALASLDAIDAAITTIAQTRANFGAAGNRFEAAVTTIQSFTESLSAANSRIRDVDVAAETANMSRSQILTQAGISVLSQANQLPQLALKLLQ